MYLWVIAALLLAFAIYLLADWCIHKFRCTERTEATVSDICRNRPGRMQKETKNYYPVYRFVFEEKEYLVSPKEPARTNRWKTDDKVSLHFDPQNPDRFYVGHNLSDLYFGILSLLLCLLLCMMICTT